MQVPIEVTLDGSGNFLRARVITKKEGQMTIMPATEGSAGRTSTKLAPYSLGDKLQYTAGDYPEYGGSKNSGFDKYIARLKRWCNSEYSVEPVRAVLKYCEKKTLISDLIDQGVLCYNEENEAFPSKWSGESDKPLIFAAMQGEQLDCSVRFGVEIPERNESRLWMDKTVWESWTEYYLANKVLEDNEDIENNSKKLPEDKRVFCYIEGKPRNFTGNHQAKIRNAGDGAKLISSNDSSGFTFRGKFWDDSQACEIGYEVSQKAHNALRWLINRQGTKEGDLAVVAWAVSGAEIPNPARDTFSLMSGFISDDEKHVYTAQDTALKLDLLIKGYSAKLFKTDSIIVMALDSATPGRLAVTYYRELTGSEFLERIYKWHSECCWKQKFGKDRIFTGAPSPKDIAETAGGKNIDGKFKKTIIASILQCIIDNTPIPDYIVRSSVRNASKRHSMEHWEWEKALGIACALYRKQNFSKEYEMALEKERNTRDYLYGRLLAVADCLEGFALSKSREFRDTNAARLMQRFADKPYSTWRTLELSLAPYRTRLGHMTKKYDEELSQIMSMFEAESFSKDTPLSGEFLLGYHTQKTELYKSEKTENSNNEGENDESEKQN
jgi:CRISPR-associated protein Csd1